MKYTPFDEEAYGDAGELIRLYLATSTRPKKMAVATNSVLGIRTSPERIAEQYVAVSGSTELLVRRVSTFVAYGGRLEFDVLLVVGFDGTRSPLLDVRYMQRPERSAKPITASGLRLMPLESIVREAVSVTRAVFRRVAEDEVWLVDEEEREAVNTKAARAARYTARSSASEAQLQLVAEEYRQGVIKHEHPTKRVQQVLGLPSRDVAAKWVQRARKAGYLPPAPGERRGGFKK